MWLLAGGLAAALAWLLNKHLARLGSRAVVSLGPALEEALKTGLAATLGASLVATHLVFGLAEGLAEVGRSRRRRGAAAAAVIGHAVFGLIAWLALQASGSYPVAWLAAAVVHSGYNLGIAALHRRA